MRPWTYETVDAMRRGRDARGRVRITVLPKIDQESRLVRLLSSAVEQPWRRVLFVTNMWPDERQPWYGTFIETQARSLEQLGIAVDVLYMRGYVRKDAYLAAAPYPPALARGRRYDVVHSHYGHSGIVARLQLAAPYVLSYCGDDLLRNPRRNGEGHTLKSRLEVAVFRRLAYLCDATITKSKEMEQVLPRRVRARNHVIPNGVDLAAFTPVPRDEARRRLGWELGETAILFVGDPRRAGKNYPLAEEVSRRVSDTLPRARLRVAAAVPPQEMPLWMSAADVLLFPTKSEGSPNAVKEAMAAQLPIVATPVGDVRERLSGLPGCFVVQPDAGRLAEAVIMAVRHGRVPEAREAVAALSLENVAQRVSAVYDKVIAEARRPRHRHDVEPAPKATP
jgi:glycosyltransferase involved in cell wall biosynthesis